MARKGSKRAFYILRIERKARLLLAPLLGEISVNIPHEQSLANLSEIVICFRTEWPWLCHVLSAL